MKKSFNKISKILIYIAIIFSTMSPIFALAQGGSGQPQGGGSGQPSSPSTISIDIKNPFKCSGDTCTIPGFINTILNSILLPIGGVVAVLMIMYAGFLYVTAQGNETQIKKAHQALLWAVIGAAILLGAKVISDAIQSTINQLQ